MRIEIDFSNNFGKIKKKITDETAKRVERASIHLQSSIKKTLTGQRSGKVYKIPHTSKTYTASKPGEPPAVRTGDLRNSYKYKLVKSNGEILGVVGSDLKKSVYLEKGTSRIKPRPHFLVTYEKQRRTLKEILSEKIK